MCVTPGNGKCEKESKFEKTLHKCSLNFGVCVCVCVHEREREYVCVSVSVCVI